MVAGKVKKINKGLTNILSSEITAATTTAVPKLPTVIPGKRLDNSITATAVNKSFKNIFIVFDFMVTIKKMLDTFLRDSCFRRKDNLTILKNYFSI